MGNLMRKWMKKDASVAEPETSAAELDMMARVEDSIAVVEGDDGIEPAETAANFPAEKLRQFEASLVQGHALDLAPVNSKIVVVKVGGAENPLKRAVLAGPDGAKQLPDGDAAHGLAEGARIMKVAEGKYVSIQLSPADDRAELVTTTATEAIARFNQHFHDVQP